MFNNDWDALLAPEFDKPYYRELTEFLKKEYAEHTVYPERRDIFAALCTTAYRDVRRAPGARARIFRAARRRHSAVAFKHLQGAQKRARALYPRQRLPDQMGAPGRSAAQQLAHRPRRRAEKARPNL